VNGVHWALGLVSSRSSVEGGGGGGAVQQACDSCTPFRCLRSLGAGLPPRTLPAAIQAAVVRNAGAHEKACHCQAVGTPSVVTVARGKDVAAGEVAFTILYIASSP
jgi:hypothetical protein